MRMLSSLFALLHLTSVCCQSSDEKNIAKNSSPVPLSDPFIMLHKDPIVSMGQMLSPNRVENYFNNKKTIEQ